MKFNKRILRCLILGACFTLPVTSTQVHALEDWQTSYQSRPNAPVKKEATTAIEKLIEGKQDKLTYTEKEWLKKYLGMHYFGMDDIISDGEDNWDNAGVEPSGTGGKTNVGSIAIGKKAYVNGGESIAFGTGARVVDGSHSLAIGTDSYAKSSNSMAIGSLSKAIQDSSMAIGVRSNALATGSMALGIASEATINYAHAFGYAAKAYAYGATAVGNQAKVEKGASNAISIGSETNVKGKESVLVGSLSNLIGENSIGIGTSVQVDKNDSVAIGGNAITREENTVAIGRWVQANGAGTTVLGQGAIAESKAINSTVLGRKAIANADGSVALGSYSTANRVGGLQEGIDFGTALDSFYAEKRGELETKKKAMTDAQTALEAAPDNKDLKNKYEEAKLEYHKFISTWTATSGEVSVGDNQKGLTRQITNVAAGTFSTDAVNVAQLQSLASAPMQFKFGTTTWNMPLNKFRMEFADGIRAEKITDSEGNTVTKVTLDKKSLKNDNDFKGPKGDQGKAGPAGPPGSSAFAVWKDAHRLDKPNATKDDFFKSLQGKSAYDIWKEQPENSGKTMQQFLKSMKGGVGKLISTDGTVKLKETKDTSGDITGYDLSVDTGSLYASIDEVGASSAALSALRPMEFTPDDKWSFSAGYGHYRNANAMALGTFYRPNENMLISIGATAGENHHMLNVGVSWKVGNGKSNFYIKSDMIRQIEIQKTEIQRQKVQIELQKAEIDALKMKMSELDDLKRKVNLLMKNLK